MVETSLIMSLFVKLPMMKLKGLTASIMELTGVGSQIRGHLTGFTTIQLEKTYMYLMKLKQIKSQTKRHTRF